MEIELRRIIFFALEKFLDDVEIKFKLNLNKFSLLFDDNNDVKKKRGPKKIKLIDTIKESRKQIEAKSFDDENYIIFNKYLLNKKNVVFKKVVNKKIINLNETDREFLSEYGLQTAVFLH